MAKCSICGRKAVDKIEYARKYLCSKHYTEFIEEKVRRSIKRYGLIKKGSKILLAVSGGKDSIALLTILSKLSKEIHFKPYVLHIDLGIGKYSAISRKIVEKVVQEVDLPLIVVELKDFLGMGVPELAKKSGRPSCSVCGIIKRYIMNAVAIELKADAIATGHNLDDIMTFILKEFLQQNLVGIAKLVPRIDNIDNAAAAKIRPLYEVFERETLIYILINKVEFVKEECPEARSNTLNNVLKNHIYILEEKFPGIKLSFIRSFIRNIDKYPKLHERIFMKCSICGLISSGIKCSYCRLTEKTHGKPLGMYTREYIRKLLEKRGLL
ncbi:MAG: TIGR00269 family protein [Thermoprotei archaeon]|nr:MAG: TIGR00269 family protein [Thermoprotei archaeon]